MNELMCVPNYNENKLICSVDYSSYRKMIRNLHANGYYTNDKYVIPQKQLQDDTIYFFYESTNMARGT